MSLSKKNREMILADILDTIIVNPKKVVNVIEKKYSISKQTIYNYLRKLEEIGKIETVVMGKSKYYILKESKYTFEYTPEGLSEDQVWIEDIKPILPNMKKNMLDICSYGFTEILNNAIDHAQATSINVTVEYSPLTIQFNIIDNGIGIFKKIQKHLNLQDPRYSILELAKGKLTSDPKRHSGEGIFFTSRVFDQFLIWSGDLVFTSDSKGDTQKDFIFEDFKKREGTVVVMINNIDSNKELVNVFNQFTDEDTQGFTKTVIPVKLMKYEGMELISRSQAKRLITRFDRFNEVILDFAGIEIIGQAFADELFRVFVQQHPNVHLQRENTNQNVENMIKHVLNSNIK